MARDSEESTPQEIIEEWLVDYVYACVLEEFGNHGTFETNFNRDFIQALCDTVAVRRETNETLDQQVMKLFVICNIADGASYLTGPPISDDPEQLSPLETLLEQTVEIKHLFGDNANFKSWLANIKQQAVLICCRSENFEVAQRVFSRIWSGKKPSIVVKKKRSELQAVIDSKDSNHPTLEQHPYQTLMEQTQVMLRQLEDNPHHLPFLHNAALREQRRLYAPDRPTSVGCQTSATPSLTQLTVSPAEFGQLVAGSKLPEMKGQPMRLPDKWREKWMTKVKEIGKDKEKYLSTMPSFNDSDSEEAEPRQLTSPNTNKKSVEKPPPNSPETNNNISHEKSPKRTSPTKSKDANKVQKRPLRHNNTDAESPNKRRELARASPTRSRDTPQKRPLPSDNTESPSKRRLPPNHTASGSSPVVTSSTPDRQHKSLQDFRYRRNINREDRHAVPTTSKANTSKTSVEDIFIFDGESESGQASDEEMPRLTLPEKVPLRRSLAPSVHQVSYCSGGTKRTKWTQKEEEDLYRAVKECGVGNWADMKKYHSFPGRSNVNLKDKWRTMLRVGQVQELDNKFHDKT